jgi:hypothetical protein
MKFRWGLIIGIAIGWLLATRIRRNVDEEVQGRLASMANHPATQRIAGQGRKIIEKAGFRGTGVIQRARRTIQRRLEADADDFSMN